MNEQIKAKLLTSLDVLQKGIEGVWDFGKQEIPEVIKEYLTYNFYSNAFWGLFWLGFVLLIGVILYKLGSACYKHSKSDEDRTGSVFFPLVVFVVFSVFPANWGLSYIDTAVKIKLAPRVYLLEQAKTLISEVKNK